MFEDLNIPIEYVPQALTALKKHSQAEMFGSSKLNKENLISKIDGEKCNEMFDLFQVPIKLDMTLEELSKVVK